ncbi:CbbX (plastid) [Cryptomonas paramecium]|uniref:CbbX n=1 Tax=Cryptomonas paramaecium TaxID=2898 RepID=D2IS66_9CRYP|nr:CbbX [Cryptomonas paramecium]ACT46758.1 CbbX [Cryptomonas paramecium]BDA98038.1 CbbX Rubisco expresion Protein [Cryptomonas paramecium]|mmetsp:Transcript_62380/g.167332  ORF Transcript_62380/g.167332 Transcript_62380/m.167332 type:complete len:290 (-) Transcript_62380:1309-2178(-)
MTVIRHLEGDALVSLKEEYEERRLQEVFDDLDSELVGLLPIKNRLKEIAALLIVHRLRAHLGLSFSNPGLHMSFTGNPGTGKTTVALKMADILFRLGYIRNGHLVTVTRDDLVGQYIGHTAPKTKEVLKKAMGGVLFIDEAYYLYKPDNERDYGVESIEILLQVMENQRDDLVVIFAGYKDSMDKFYASNPGLSSRVANHVDFPDYSLSELLAIAKLMLSDQQYVLTTSSELALCERIKLRLGQPHFANARTIRNIIDQAKMRQASRIFNSGGRVLTKVDLVTLQVEDM